MGRGEDLRLALPEQEDEQRLRAAAGERGGLHLRGDEPPDGEEIGTLMRVFRQFPNGVLGSSADASRAAPAGRIMVLHADSRAGAFDGRPPSTGPLLGILKES